MTNRCTHCGALKWPGEVPSMCCGNGKVKLPELAPMPDYLRRLYLGEDRLSPDFFKNIRSYNSAFQMTSFGHHRVTEGGFNPTFKIQGQVYHRIGSLLPTPGIPPVYLQIYFMGDPTEQTARRESVIPGTRMEILGPIQEELHAVNPYIRQFKTAYDRRGTISEDHKVVILADRTPVGEHQRCFNAPTANEVAAIITIPEGANRRDIVLEWQDGAEGGGRLKRINELHPAYDPLQYPLLFPNGEDGFRLELPHFNPATGLPVFDPQSDEIPEGTRNKVTPREFYCYRFMVRPDSDNILLRARQLLDQFVVDMFAKVECLRLRYLLTHQAELRAVEYNILRDEVHGNDNPAAADIGIGVRMPASFTGGPRYMMAKGQDGLTYVKYYGRPDLFITMTCNPKWPELESNVFDEPYMATNKQKADHRHDLIARIFKLKMDKMLDLINKGQIFGTVKAFLTTVEWQKRGLPHCHSLFWLETKIRPTDIDSVISAEFPDPQEDPALFDIIKSSMLHGPCGNLNPGSPCMENGKCTKKYPRRLIAETKSDVDTYPLYRRTPPENGGHTARVHVRGRGEVEVDNSWVVPHNKLLCKTFNAHINVEYCNSVKAIKYVCKYCTKGADRAVYRVVGNAPDPNDEIACYQCGRYLSTNEGFWRVFGFDIHRHYPPVVPLPIHLENGQRVYFNQNNIQQVAAEPRRTKLTAFMELAQTDQTAKGLFYHEVPQYFTWKDNGKVWQPRQQDKQSLSRVAAIHPVNSECFHLRMLLHTLRGPTSFEELKIVDGEVCATFKEACRRRGLLDNDDHYDLALGETALHSSPRALRRLFATIITHCHVSDPLALWNKYKAAMCDDILHQAREMAGEEHMPINDDIINQALIWIEDASLEIGGFVLTRYGLPVPQRANAGVFNRYILRETNYDREELQAYVQQNETLLTPDQEAAYADIIRRLATNVGGIVFLDAPGGTGKTFAINLILAYVRGQGDIAIAVASSGIAATLLKGGRTAHSTFKLPLNLRNEEHPTCNINAHDAQAELLRRCKLIVWDEATMANKNGLRALDNTLRELRPNRGTMGGVLLLLAGDFRQTLPIIPKGTPADEIDACLKSSYLWREVRSYRFTTNMRARLQNDPTFGEFANTLLSIGNGTIGEVNGSVDLTNVGQCVGSTEDLCTKVYPNLEANYTDTEWLCQRAVLAPTNEEVNKLNSELLKQIHGEEKCYNSVDTVTDPEQAATFPPDFLNSQNLPNMPPHELRLRVGCPIMLLRNLDAPTLCNGTRLAVKKLHNNVIEATILTGQGKGQTTFIPKLPLEPSDCPIPMRRVQFPVKLSFAITINKAQGQSLQVVGLNLTSPCFSHGQLYVGCSRVGTPANLYIYAPNNRTKNVVYKAALQ